MLDPINNALLRTLVALKTGVDQLKREDGQDALEYIVIGTIVAIVLFVAFRLFGDQLADQLEDITGIFG